MKEKNAKSTPHESITVKTVVTVAAILLVVSLTGFALRKLVYDLFSGDLQMSWTEVTLVSVAVVVIAAIVGYARIRKPNQSEE